MKSLRKMHKITLNDLSNYSFSTAYLSKIERGDRKITEQKLDKIIIAFNKIFEDRNIDTIINRQYFYTTPEQRLDILVRSSIIDKSFFLEEKQNEIKLFTKQHETSNLRFEYLMGKYYKTIDNKYKSLEVFTNLLNNFDCSVYLYSILIEIIRLEKIEKTYDIFKKYKPVIDKASIKVKSLLYYNIAVNLLRCKKYKKAMILFNEVIDIPIKTKQYYKSWSNIGICLQYQKRYEEAIEAFKNYVSDPTNYHDLKICYVNIMFCAKKSDNEILVKVTLKKLESVLKMLKDSTLYQTYYCIGLTYLYLKEKEKAIKAFEKEINMDVDFENPSFNIFKYLDTITNLIQLYGIDPINQQKLINHIVKIPFKYLDKEWLVKLLKYYFDNKMEYEGKLLLKNFNI